MTHQGRVPPAQDDGEELTTGITGGWKDSRFTWALWRHPATLRAASSLLRTSDLAALSPVARGARGISAVFTSSISRSDQGGYGTFAPAQVQ